AVTLNWTQSAGATSYDLYRNGALYTSGLTGLTFYNNVGLVAGQSYTYFVRARNSTGTTDSQTITVSIPANVCGGQPSISISSPISSTTWTAGTSQPVIWTVSGTPPSPISYYAIDYYDGSTWTYSVAYAYPPALSVAWPIPSTAASTQARVQVRAVNSAGSSMFGNYSANFTIISSAGSPTSVPNCNNRSPSPASAVTVNFNGSASTGSSPSCGIASYQWTFGDGGTGTGPYPSHIYYPAPGTSTSYNVNLTVTDCNGKPA